MPQDFMLKVNGADRRASVEPDTPLLYILRNDFELNGPRFGCGLAQCGACTVLLEGRPTRSCVTPVSAVGSKPVTTLEGLGTKDTLHPLQKAFIEEQAAQCGYCIPGMMMRAEALLRQRPQASEAQIRAHMDGHLCRCGSYPRIMKAIQVASTTMAGATR